LLTWSNAGLISTLLRTALEQQVSIGADSGAFHGQQTQYWLLADDHDKALDSLQKYADKGGWATPRLSDDTPLLKALEGMPRYEAIQEQLLEHLNSERAKLGLEPVGLERT
jgi:hypothetical protein